jgi:hypothetical protein
MSSVVIDQSECLNCGTALHGEFCSGCGQKAGHSNPTFHDLWHDVTHETLHVDGRLWSSLRLLFTKPGFLTQEYIAGRRTTHFPPLRLYLICSVAYFAIAAFAPSDATVQVDDRRGQTVVIGGVKISGDSLIGNKSNEEIAERIHRAQHDWLPKILFALVPVWALLVKVVTWREHRNFPEHLYFALHVLGMNFGLNSVAALLRFAHWKPIEAAWLVVSFLFLFWYVTRALQRVYGRSTAVALRRTAALLFMYAIAVTITFGLFVVIALRT